MKKSAIGFLLLALAGVVLWLASRPDYAPQTMPEMERFNPGEVAAITLIREGAKPVLLIRSGELWQLMAAAKPATANGDAVSHLLSDLAGMEVTRVVTRNPEQYENMQVGSGATRVTLKDENGTIVFDLFIGKQGTDLLSTYVRKADAAEVIAVNRVLNWQVNRSQQSWLAEEPAPPGIDGEAGSGHDES